MSTQQAEILPMATGEIAIYAPFRNQLADLKKQNEKLVFDYESPQGNKDARSHIYKLRKTKTAVEAARKEEKAASLEYGRKVDAQAKEITTELETMIEVHLKPIEAIEEREKMRVEAIQAKIAGIIKYKECHGHSSSETANAIAELNAIVIDESYGELIQEAMQAKEAALLAQQKQYEFALKQEEEQAELQRLRQEAIERDKKEREEKIARESAEKARQEAQEQREAEIRMAAEAQAAAEKRELELKLQAERSERERLEAEQRLENERKEAEAQRVAAAEKAEREKKEAEERAATAERQRIADEQAAAAAVIMRREADVSHRKSVLKLAIDALESHIKADPEIDAEAIVMLIATAKIPHISITY